jgi:hypothetical protein
MPTRRNALFAVCKRNQHPTFMRPLSEFNFLSLLFYVIVIPLFISCSTSKIVYKKRVDESRIRFFVTQTPKPKKSSSNFYAQVDSNNVRIYYSFFASDINKNYDNDNNVLYVLTSNRKPMTYLTRIDSLVLAKADNLMDSLGYKDLKRAKGATGYFIEVLRTPL